MGKFTSSKRRGREGGEKKRREEGKRRWGEARRGEGKGEGEEREEGELRGLRLFGWKWRIFKFLFLKKKPHEEKEGGGRRGRERGEGISRVVTRDSCRVRTVG